MTVWIPHPVLSASLLATWLLLNQSFSIGQTLLGAALAIAGGKIMSVLQPRSARIGSVSVGFRLAGVVLTDVLRSNIAVAQIILGRRQDLSSGFVEIPLELQHRTGLAVLGCIITATPGTLWVDHDPGRSMLTIHVLDLVDDATWIRTIKGRYERRLLEMFP